MSKAKLKKHLLSLTKEQITDIVLELYDARKEAKDYLEFYLAPDCNAELEKEQESYQKRVLPNSWIFRKAVICQMSKSHFRFSKAKTGADHCCRFNVVLYRTRMRIHT